MAHVLTPCGLIYPLDPPTDAHAGELLRATGGLPLVTLGVLLS